MLQPAALHGDYLTRKFIEIAFDDKYKYYFPMGFRDKFVITEGTWNRHEFVSVDRGGKVLGYMGYNIDRDSMVAHALCIINFGDPHPIFAKDLAHLIRDVFERFQFRKLRWMVSCGNPAERHYDRMCERLGGRIVGIYEKEDKLIDGTYTDQKTYEILRDRYRDSRKNK